MTPYIEVDRAMTSTGRKCDKCGDIISRGMKYLHMNKNKHLFILCGKCLYILTIKIVKDNPLVKAEAMADLICTE